MTRKALRSLKSRNFSIYFGGQLISLTGSWIHNVAQSWLVYRMTGSAAWLGAFVFLEQLPSFLLSPFSAALLDRVPLGRAIFSTQAALSLVALSMGALAITGHLTPATLALLVLINGVVNAFDITARSAFLAEMVPSQDIPNAIGLHSVIFNAARIAGPLVAGAVVAQRGEGACFLINGFTFWPLLIGLGLMSGARLRTAAAPLPRSYLGSIRDGFHYAWREKAVRTPLLQIAVACFTGYAHLVLLPVFVAKTFSGDAPLLGAMASSVGIGAIAGSLALAARVGTVGLERTARVSGLALAATMCLFAASSNLPFSLALLTLAGFFMVNHMSATTVLLQSCLPTALRTRVMSIHTMAHTGISPLGALVAGYLAETHGAAAAVAVFAGMLAVGVGSFALVSAQEASTVVDAVMEPSDKADAG